MDKRPVNKKNPFFSIVIPTRDRPQYLSCALQSLLLQSFTDFEVIVCDNYTDKSSDRIFQKHSDERFKYITPPSSLPMHDNWEYACNFARGEYVTVLIDKTFFRPSTLEIVYKSLLEYPSELLTWHGDGFIPEDETLKESSSGTYVPQLTISYSPFYYDAKEELKRRYSMKDRRGGTSESFKYYWGKICFGFYHKKLTERIKKRLGRLFFGISPDYTSMVSALTYTNTSLDIGLPLLTSFITLNTSNGARASRSIEYGLNFLRQTDPSLQILKKLPLKELYSNHNLVAYDLIKMKTLLAAGLENIELNKANLLIQVRQDLNAINWINDNLKKNQYDLWKKYFLELPLENKIKVTKELATIYKNETSSKIMNNLKTAISTHFPSLRNTVSFLITDRTSKRPKKKIFSAKKFNNAIEAAIYADKIYNSLVKHE